MPIERYFVDCELKNNESVQIRDREFHHLSHVMRSHTGDQIELINGRGQLAEGMILESKKDYAIVQIRKCIQAVEKPTKIILAQALTKQNRLDFILEKATELGVDAFWLFPGELSIKKELSEHQLEKARLQLIAALKQCGRLFIPEIHLFPALQKCRSIEGTAFFGDVSPTAEPLKDQIIKIEQPSSLIFFTGPESGFSSREIARLKELGVKGAKLHENILRTDTASILAIGLFSHLLLKI
jgi:16S rRNA (uracil1498-N3)-methyltransferase